MIRAQGLAMARLHQRNGQPDLLFILRIKKQYGFAIARLCHAEACCQSLTASCQQRIGSRRLGLWFVFQENAEPLAIGVVEDMSVFSRRDQLATFILPRAKPSGGRSSATPPPTASEAPVS